MFTESDAERIKIVIDYKGGGNMVIDVRAKNDETIEEAIKRGIGRVKEIGEDVKEYYEY
jgi:hypothetical protein